MSQPILVVGAGPVGLTVALSLARQGVPVQVIEAEPGLTVDQRAGSFHPPTLEMLEPLGVTAEMQKIGLKVPRWQLRDREQGVIVEWDLGLIADHTRYPHRFHLEQHRLTPILFHKLHGFPHAKVSFSTSFTEAVQVIVISTFEDFTARGFTSNAYVADPKEWAAVFHMPHDGPPGLWRMAFPVHPDESEQAVLADDAVEARMQRFMRRDSRYELPYKGIYRVHQRVAKQWRVGRILLAGDAAHLNNPLGAFGLNGGLHDAIMLADYLGKVVRGEADDALLDRYVRQRRTANVEFVQTQSIANKRMLEEGDLAAREQNFADLRRVAGDRTAARDFLLRSSMIWSVKRAAEIA